MKIIMVISVLLSSLNIFSQNLELDSIYEGFYEVQDLNIYDDDYLFILDNSYNGTIWKVNRNNLSKIDSLVLGYSKGELKLSPDKKYLINSHSTSEVYDANSLEKLFELPANYIYFKNDNELIFINEDGIYNFNLTNNETSIIFEDIPYDEKYISNKMNIKYNYYSPNFNKMILAFEATQGKFIYIIDVTSKKVDKIIEYSNSPILNTKNDDLIFNQFGSIYKINLANIELEPTLVSNFPGLEPGYFKFSDSGKYLTLHGISIYNSISYNHISSPTIAGHSMVLLEEEDIAFVLTEKLIKYKFSQSLNSIKLNSLNIYPNPTSNLINIDIETPTNIELFDIFGNKLLEDYNTKLDVSNLTPGTYYIKFMGQTKMVVKIW